MKFGDVVGSGAFGTTGFLSADSDLAALERTIAHNLPVLSRFAQVVVATNFGDGQDDLVHRNAQLWRRHLPDCVLIDSPRNRGHSIGTADLENLLFDYTRASGPRWLCKSANDVLLWPEVLDIPVLPASFYFLNAVSFDALREHDFALDLFTHGFLFPQTTFYAIDVHATDHLYDRETLDRAWAMATSTADYNGRIWEYLPGWTCERLLRDCVIRNRLRRWPLVTDTQWRQILQWVIDERIHDCSFKGLRINGICHAQGLASPDDALVVATR